MLHQRCMLAWRFCQRLPVLSAFLAAVSLRTAEKQEAFLQWLASKDDAMPALLAGMTAGRFGRGQSCKAVIGAEVYEGLGNGKRRQQGGLVSQAANCWQSNSASPIELPAPWHCHNL